MTEPLAADALPSPLQLRNYCAAAEAARKARRLREASRAAITGNIALGVCTMGTVLVLLHAGWLGGAEPFAACGLLFAYLACLMLSLRWMRRQRSQGSVQVIDVREAEAQRAAPRPVRAALVILALFVFQGVSAVGWSLAFPHMSNAAILAVLSVGPVLAVGYFVHRFVAFRLWEDLLFGASVVMAFTPIFLNNWSLTPISLLSLATCVMGTVCLHRRWVAWTRTLPAESGESASGEGRS